MRAHIATMLAVALATADLPAQSQSGTAPVAPLPIMRQLPGMEFPFMFALRRAPRDLDGAICLEAADVDGDGDLDVAIGPITGRPPRLVLNDGHGRFTEVTGTQMPDLRTVSMRQFGLIDIDGDGDVDFLGGNTVSVTGTPVTILVNDGTGRFSDASRARFPGWLSYPFYDNPGCALADFDADGDPDAVLGDGRGYSKSYRLLRNDGTGVFTYDPTAFPDDGGLRGDGAGETRVGDLDGDGDLDVVGPAAAPGGAIWLNDSTGHFTDVSLTNFHPIHLDSFATVDLGDVDADGDLDLVIGRYYMRAPPLLYLNDGRAHFHEAPPGSVPAAATAGIQNRFLDLDGDGDLDIHCMEPPLPAYPGWIHAGRDHYLRNDGAGRFTLDTDNSMIERSTNGGVTDIACGDFDADGDLDLVCGDHAALPWPPDRLRYYQNTTRHVWSAEPPARGSPWPVRVAGHAGSTAVLVISLRQATTPLPPAGTLALDPAYGFVWPHAITIPPAREIAVRIPIPNLPALGGLPLYAQVLIQESAGPRLTNLWVADAIQ